MDIVASSRSIDQGEDELAQINESFMKIAYSSFDCTKNHLTLGKLEIFDKTKLSH